MRLRRHTNTVDMDYSIDNDEDTIDLSKYSPEDSCLWLLNRLRTSEYENNPYTLPFCSYVITWHRAVPITCIVMAQNPYPNNIYSPIAAAMSYSTELCNLEVKKHRLKIPVPPTVEILANDLYLNAGMDKESSINILKNGWALVDEGILLVNEGVFTHSNDPEYYRESANQCNVIIRLLRETEQYGKRTVDVYGLGEAGQRMASNLCSWYKSNTVRLSKHTATHPAALSRRFTNFSHPECHMGVPSFSKSLAKHLSNHVALLHTMAKKSDVDIRIQQYADIIRSASEQFLLHQQAQTEFNKHVKELLDMDKTNSESLNAVLQKVYTSGETLAFRTGVSSSVMANIQRMGQSVSGQVSKAGPSLVNPTTMSLSQHVGQEHKPAPSIGITARKLNLSKKKDTEATTENSSYSQISPPASVQSVQSSGVTPTKLKLTKSNLSTNSTPVKNKLSEPASTSLTKSTTSNTTGEPVEVQEPKVTSSTSAHFRKINLAENSKKLQSSGKLKKQSVVDDQYKMTTEQKNQLSSVEAVVQTYKEDASEDEDCIAIFELIQHDISHMTKYNPPVVQLIEAIDQDIQSIPKFDFANWVIDSSIPSATFSACKEVFSFDA